MEGRPIARRLPLEWVLVKGLTEVSLYPANMQGGGVEVWFLMKRKNILHDSNQSCMVSHEKKKVTCTSAVSSHSEF
jgi:hypothetical protein